MAILGFGFNANGALLLIMSFLTGSAPQQLQPKMYRETEKIVSIRVRLANYCAEDYTPP